MINCKWLQKHNCSYTKRPSCFPINYIPVTVIPKLLMIRTENPDLPILNKFSIFLLTVEKKLYCILVISAIACDNDIVKDIMYSEACLN